MAEELKKPKGFLAFYHQFEESHHHQHQQVNLMPETHGWGMEIHRGPGLTCRPNGAPPSPQRSSEEDWVVDENATGGQGSKS